VETSAVNIRNILAKKCLDNFFMQGRILYDCYLIFISGVGGMGLNLVSFLEASHVDQGVWVFVPPQKVQEEGAG